MQRLVIKLLIYFGLLSVFIVLLFFSSGFITSNHRLGLSSLKQSRLSLIKGRQLILIGGSNLHYGINSRLIEDSIGFSVTNMGIQGSIGIEYYFNEILCKVKENDIVIFKPEPALIYKISSNGEQTLYNLLSKYPKGIQYLNFVQIVNSPKYIGMAIKENIEYFLPLIAIKLQHHKTIYENTNEWGDYIGHKGLKSTYVSDKVIETRTLNEIEEYIDNVIALLKIKEEIIKSKGAHLLISFSPVAISSAEIDIFQMIDSKFSKAFAARKICSLNENILPDNYFFDTSHHLLYDKRNERTQVLVENLICYLNRYFDR